MNTNTTWLQAVREKCNQHCVLLILDEIQAGFGRTGSLWAFEQFGIVPDILLLGKALGGGMPLGAFIADQRLMNTLTYAPVLGHITTFGGHPVSCAAGKAAFEELMAHPEWIQEVPKKNALLKSRLQHPKILSVKDCVLWMSLQFATPEITQAVAHACIQNGLVTDWFLFAPDRIRIAPPLVITEEELLMLCEIVLKSVTNSFCKICHTMPRKSE